MAMTITTPHATGQVASTTKGVTHVATSNTFAASDVGRIIYLTSGDGAGQYRRITAYTSQTTVTIDYPWDVSAFQAESYSNGDAIRDFSPAADDWFTVSLGFGDISGISGYADTWENVNTTNRTADLIEGETFSVGNSSANTGRVVFYEEDYRFKWNSKNIYNYAERTAGLGSAIVLGRLDPGYVVNFSINSTDSALSSVSANQVVHKEGSATVAGTIWKNISGGSLTNVAYTDLVSTNDDWQQIESNGLSVSPCRVTLTDHDPGEGTALWLNDGSNANNGSANGGLENAYGHFHHNGTYWVIDPVGSATADTDLSGDNRVFWRIYNLDNNDSNTRSFVRLYQNTFEGGIGGRLRGEKSMVLDCDFYRGGNTAGPFNPTFFGDSYFGLWKGNRMHDKDQGAYVWFSEGNNVEILSPDFSETSYAAYIASGNSNSNLRFVDFDMNLINTGIRAGGAFVSMHGSLSASNRVRVENSITVNIVTEDLSVDTTQSKLGWTSSDASGNENNRDYEDTTDGGTIPETTSGTFETVRLQKWNSGNLETPTNPSDLNIDADNAIDYGDYIFAIVSFANQNVYFSNDMRDARTLTYTTTEDNTVTGTAVDTNSYTEISNAQEWRNRGKARQYDDMHELPDVQSEFIRYSADGSGGRAQVNQGGASYVADVVFATTGSNVMRYNETDDQYELKVPTTGFTDDIILDSTSDLTIPAGLPIIGAVTCQNLVNSWANNETVINTDGAQNYSAEIDNSSGDVTITIEDADVTDLVLTVENTTNAVNVVLKNVTEGVDTLVSNSSSHITFQEEITVIFDCGEAYDSDNITYSFFENNEGVLTAITAANTSVSAGTGNDVECVLTVTQGNSVDYAISYVGREMSAGNASSGTDTTATSSAQGNADISNAPSSGDKQTFYETAITIDDGAGGTIDSDTDSVDVTISVTSSQNGATLNGDEAKAWVRWEMMHEQAWVDAVAAGYIDADAIQFTVGEIRFTNNLATADSERININHLTNTQAFQIGQDIGFVNHQTEADLSASGTISSTDTALEIRFPQVTTGATAGAVYNVATQVMNEKHIYNGFGSNSGLNIPSPDRSGDGLLTSKYSNS